MTRVRTSPGGSGPWCVVVFVGVVCCVEVGSHHRVAGRPWAVGPAASSVRSQHTIGIHGAYEPTSGVVTTRSSTLGKLAVFMF
eukprot:COSAG01_NODE_505_length_16132_cov_49.751528_10_plen_83_part_00